MLVKLSRVSSPLTLRNTSYLRLRIVEEEEDAIIESHSTPLSQDHLRKKIIIDEFQCFSKNKLMKIVVEIFLLTVEGLTEI